MTARANKPKIDVDALWERPSAAKRAVPVPLDRNRIVSAAIELADQGGLEAVSLRSVATALGAGPMRLYGHLTTKDELLELMVDRIYGEMAAADPADGTWQEASAAIASRLRHAVLAHEWLVDLLGGRPHQGPGALAFTEFWLAALSGDAVLGDIDAVMDALRTLNAYVLGALRGEIAELRAERDTGQDKAVWQAADSEHMQRVIATGRFPMIAQVISGASQPRPEIIFERGLAAVLSGLGGAQFKARANRGHKSVPDMRR